MGTILLSKIQEMDQGLNKIIKIIPLWLISVLFYWRLEL